MHGIDVVKNGAKKTCTSRAVKLKPPASIDEWLALTEIALPCISDSRAQGAIYQVAALGFLVVTVDDCLSKSIIPVIVENGNSILPTAEIEVAGSRQILRLPGEFSEWVISCMAMARLGENPLPTSIEFGIANGLPFGKFSVESRSLN